MKKTIHIPHQLHKSVKEISAKSEVSIESFVNDALLNRIRDLNDAPSGIELDAPATSCSAPTKIYNASRGQTYKPTKALK